MNRAILLFSFILLSVATPAFSAVDPFAENIRPTDALTPEQEEKSFHLPPGFEIHLIASEPQIGKPVNLAFDDKGRLWVTETHEYPFPAPPSRPGVDKIQVIELDNSGHVAKITNFAEHLNIPIGIYPFKDGCLAYSIPMISFYHDTDGDGHADKVDPFYGPFSYDRDTHGMSSNYVRGYDGWVYGNHGFNNLSTVHGLDGQSITMHSGNTYRFKTDGSHIEYYAHGQTNPFGLCLDPLGNLYSADSHSKPIYQLLHGGWYESLMPTNDGLGFAPNMMNHLHGSTAIAGVCFYAAEQFPAEFRGNIFVGNVVTSRLNRDSITYSGSSPRAHEEPDFLYTDDPWFRPVSTQIGPDGALYVADFYNKIIGHYEVPLTNPLRDHDHGRIWRITYNGPEAHTPAGGPFPNIAAADMPQLIAYLDNPNIWVRMMAMNEMADRVGPAAAEPLKQLLAGHPTSFQLRHALWVLYRIGALDDATLADATKSTDSAIRVHAMRILTEMPKWSEAQSALVLAGLSDPDALVKRCAADAMARHPDPADLRPLLDLLAATPRDDMHLIYTIRESIADQLRAPAGYAALEKLQLSNADVTRLVAISMAVSSPQSALFLVHHMEKLKDREQIASALRHAAEFITGPEIDKLAATVRQQFDADPDFQLELLNSLRQGMTQSAPTPALRSWALEIATQILQHPEKAFAWTNEPNSAHPTANPWTFESRQCTDGQEVMLLSSHPLGEQLTGILRSDPFALPDQISFYLAGHDGDPGAPPKNKNMVRLVDAATNETLEQVYPPRHDVAHKFTWDLKKFAGRQGRIEVIDGDTGGAYAWLAIGRLTPAVIPWPSSSPSGSDHRLESAAALAGTFSLTELRIDLLKLLVQKSASAETRAAAATALGTMRAGDGDVMLGAVLNGLDEPIMLRDKCASALANYDTDIARTALLTGFKGAPKQLEVSIATALTTTAAGGEVLLDAIKQGKAPAALLFSPAIKERLASSNLPDLDKRIADLTKGLPAPSAEMDKLLAQRKAAYLSSITNSVRGQGVFTKTCMVCHSLGGKGALIGPQLDGIGNRGLDRVLEDVLDPSRNVDPAFRPSVLHMKTGQIVTGLIRRTEGGNTILVDGAAKEFSVPTADIERKAELKISPMPANFSDTIPPDDFNNLMAFLLSQKAKK